MRKGSAGRSRNAGAALSQEFAGEESNKKKKRESKPVVKMGDAEIVPARARRVAVVGDSVVGAQGGYYARILNEYGLGFQFDAFGKTGDTTEGIKKRLPKILRKGYEELIIAGGVNDLAIFGGAKDSLWKSKFLPQLESNIREMVGLARSKGVKRILLVEVAPWGGSPNSSPLKEMRTVEYNGMLAKVARETGAILVSIHKIMEGENGRMKAALAGKRRDGKTDWLHPGKNGLELIAKRIAEAGYGVPLEENIVNGNLTYVCSADFFLPERARGRAKNAVR
ncbi:MAG: SGNH/GDSL hydrolase family protein [Candidatus Bilamarchaeaceae archaeon]